MNDGRLILGLCTKSNILRFIKTSKKKRNEITTTCRITNPFKLMFRKLKLLTFPKRVQYHTCTKMYKALNSLAPEYLSDVFTRIATVHSRDLRSVDNDSYEYQYLKVGRKPS